MRKLVITMPRSPYFIIILVGLTGMALVVLTEPTFLASGDVSQFTRGRWGGLIIALLITLWGSKGAAFPSMLFACDRRGIQTPVYPRVIEWRQVQDVEISTLKIGLSNVRGGGAVKSSSIAIRFAESIDLRSGLRPNSHGRITAEHEYTFSTEVQKEDAGDLLEVIAGFRAQ